MKLLLYLASYSNYLYGFSLLILVGVMYLLLKNFMLDFLLTGNYWVYVVVL